MASFIVILIVIIALLLALVVLVQNPKGGGLAVGFQGTTQVGGVQRTADFLEKATWYLGIALFVLCLISLMYLPPQYRLNFCALNAPD
jgi:preprotein translocase subunit SecG